MLKNFALASIIAFADAIQLECCPSCSGPDDEDWEEAIEKKLKEAEEAFDERVRFAEEALDERE